MDKTEIYQKGSKTEFWCLSSRRKYLLHEVCWWFSCQGESLRQRLLLRYCGNSQPC